MTQSLTAIDRRVEGPRSQERPTAPIVITVVLLVAMFLHLALTDVLPNNSFAGLLVLLVFTTALWMDRTPTRLRGVGGVELAMALYLLWNVYSMFAPHQYPATNPLTGAVYSVPQFIMTSVVIPFGMYTVGRYTFDKPAAVRILLWVVLVAAGYSAAVSIMQFTGPKSLVWPRFIVDGSLVPGVNTWADRAIGVFNQPVVNGLVMAIGVAVAVLLASHPSEPRWRRGLSIVVAVACGYGIYLTHTRSAWLSAVVVLILGASMARGYRRGFLIALGLIAAYIAFNWQVFTSSDRKAGGVASEGEVNDRLNMIQTALWAAEHKILTGWGILRFQAVNTYHHQQWAADVPWVHGYAIRPHENELGILAELGLIGLALWVAVLALIARRLWVAYRTLPDGELTGKPLAVTAIIAFAALIATGTTVDLRLFDFPTAVVFLVAGAAIGWSERMKQSRESTEAFVAQSVSNRHV